MPLPAEYDFLKDPELDAESKRALLQAILETNKAKRDAPMEQRRFWHNTPLMLALVGTITIAANGLVSYLASDADARRVAGKDERVFAFKIIEGELAKTGNPSERAGVLLFLVRAGILNSLNRLELERMATRDFVRAGGTAGDVGIPASLGTSTTATQFRAWLSPDGKLSSNRFAKVQEWLNKRYPDKSIIVFQLLTDASAEYEMDRIAALRDLKDVPAK